MAAYAYKWVLYRLPDWIYDDLAAEGVRDEDGRRIEPTNATTDYDGTGWLAASAYIERLEAELRKRHEAGDTAHDTQLIDWLRTRKAGNYQPSGWEATDD